MQVIKISRFLQPGRAARRFLMYSEGPVTLPGFGGRKEFKPLLIKDQ